MPWAAILVSYYVPRGLGVGVTVVWGMGGGREAPHANLSSTPSVDFDDLRGEKVKEGLNTV